jgi:hypothetical protein
MSAPNHLPLPTTRSLPKIGGASSKWSTVTTTATSPPKQIVHSFADGGCYLLASEGTSCRLLRERRMPEHGRESRRAGSADETLAARQGGLVLRSLSAWSADWAVRSAGTAENCRAVPRTGEIEVEFTTCKRCVGMPRPSAPKGIARKSGGH